MEMNDSSAQIMVTPWKNRILKLRPCYPHFYVITSCNKKKDYHTTRHILKFTHSSESTASTDNMGSANMDNNADQRVEIIVGEFQNQQKAEDFSRFIQEEKIKKTISNNPVDLASFIAKEQELRFIKNPTDRQVRKFYSEHTPLYDNISTKQHKKLHKVKPLETIKEG